MKMILSILGPLNDGKLLKFIGFDNNMKKKKHKTFDKSERQT